MVEWFVEVIKVYRSFDYFSTVRHWMADTIGPKVSRFNFYSRQCNIHYTATSSTRFPTVVRKMLFESARLVRFASLPFGAASSCFVQTHLYVKILFAVKKQLIIRFFALVIFLIYCICL